jgi:hypothetical protein
MLIKISSEIDFLTLSDDEIHALELLAYSYKDGHHLIEAPVHVFEFLAGWDRLNSRAAAVYRKLQLKWFQLGGLYALVNTKIVAGRYQSVNSVTDADDTIIEVPLSQIDMQFLAPTTLMLEDINDEDTYRLIINWFLQVKNSISNTASSYNFRVQSGGGIRISDNYKHFLETQKSLILCITDSDRKFPEDVLGATAKKFFDFDHSNFYLGKMLLIDVHERENLIPFSIYKKIHSEHGATNGHVRDSFAVLNAIREHPEAVRFIDIKDGFICKKFNCNADLKNYWISILGEMVSPIHDCKNIKCDKVLFRGFPKSLIADAVSSVKEVPTVIEINENLSSHWVRIGAEIFNWSVSTKAFIT